jgi:hypothetical protein
MPHECIVGAVDNDLARVYLAEKNSSVNMTILL